jgi:hypothetical protein
MEIWSLWVLGIMILITIRDLSNSMFHPNSFNGYARSEADVGIRFDA